MTGRGLVVPTSRTAVLTLDSLTLYLLERAGEVARDILDNRIVTWTEQGWTQQKIADEIGSARRTVSDRQRRLGVEPASSKGRPRKVELADPANSTNGSKPEVVDAEVVNDEETVSPKPPSQRIASVPFPRGGISDKADVTAYNVSDLKRVADNLIRRATPTEAAALRKLFVTYAQRAERKLS